MYMKWLINITSVPWHMSIINCGSTPVECSPIDTNRIQWLECISYQERYKNGYHTHQSYPCHATSSCTFVISPMILCVTVIWNQTQSFVSLHNGYMYIYMCLPIRICLCTYVYAFVYGYAHVRSVHICSRNIGMHIYVYVSEWVYLPF